MRLALTSIAALMTAPAFAGGLTEPAPIAPIIVPDVPVQAYSFTGFSGGIAAGYANGDFGDDDDGDGGLSLSGDGGFVGLRLNYDYDFGRFVAGASLQYDNLGVSLDNDDDADLDDQLESILRAGVRVGFDSGRNWYYLTGGYAEAELENGGDTDGYYLGLGYEVFITQNITAGAEVLTHEFDDFDNIDAADFDSGDLTTFALSVNYRF